MLKPRNKMQTNMGETMIFKLAHTLTSNKFVVKVTTRMLVTSHRDPLMYREILEMRLIWLTAIVSVSSLCKN